MLDGCDGEMSRVSHRGSKLGEWLDTIGDDLTNYGFFGGAGLGLYHDTGNELYLAAGSICVACGLVTSALEYRYLIKIGSGDLLKYPLSQGSGGNGKLAFLGRRSSSATPSCCSRCMAALSLPSAHHMRVCRGSSGRVISG